MRNVIDPQLVDCPRADTHGERCALPYRGEKAYDPGLPTDYPEIEPIARRKPDLCDARTRTFLSAPRDQQEQPRRLGWGDLSETIDIFDDRGGLYPRRSGPQRARPFKNARTNTGARIEKESPYMMPSFTRDGIVPHRDSGQDREAFGPQVKCAATEYLYHTKQCEAKRSTEDPRSLYYCNNNPAGTPIQAGPIHLCRGRTCHEVQLSEGPSLSPHPCVVSFSVGGFVRGPPAATTAFRAAARSPSPRKRPI